MSESLNAELLKLREILELSEDEINSITPLLLEGKARADFVSVLDDLDKYRHLRHLLPLANFNGGKIVALRGRFGGLKYIPNIDTQSLEGKSPPQEIESEIDKLKSIEDETQSQELRLEREFYSYVKKWAIENGYTNCMITGGQTPRSRWENPDLICVFEKFDELRSTIEFDLTSFEVKIQVTPYAVWQSAHYENFSTEVYVAFAASQSEIRGKDDGKIFQLAVDFGLGVLAWDSEHRVFTEIQSPRQIQPPQSRITLALNDFYKNEEIKKAVNSVKEKHSNHICETLARRLT